jgi:hypothetical protein
VIATPIPTIPVTSIAVHGRGPIEDVRGPVTVGKRGIEPGQDTVAIDGFRIMISIDFYGERLEIEDVEGKWRDCFVETFCWKTVISLINITGDKTYHFQPSYAQSALSNSPSSSQQFDE